MWDINENYIKDYMNKYDITAALPLLHNNIDKIKIGYRVRQGKTIFSKYFGAGLENVKQRQTQLFTPA